MALRARVENIRKRASRQPSQVYEEAGYRFDFEKLDFRINGIYTVEMGLCLSFISSFLRKRLTVTDNAFSST